MEKCFALLRKGIVGFVVRMIRFTLKRNALVHSRCSQNQTDAHTPPPYLPQPPARARETGRLVRRRRVPSEIPPSSSPLSSRAAIYRSPPQPTLLVRDFANI